jgi:succinate dehydrogenase hydrophobic anchor subunit
MKDVVLFVMCALSIAAVALVLYVGWLLYATHELLKATRNRLRPPEVARDGDGRPLKERV